MYGLLSVLAVCITIFFVIDSLQKRPITFILHKKLEEVQSDIEKPVNNEPTEAEGSTDIADGLREVIRYTQDFLGGEVDAESEHKAE